MPAQPDRIKPPVLDYRSVSVKRVSADIAARAVTGLVSFLLAWMAYEILRANGPRPGALLAAALLLAISVICFLVAVGIIAGSTGSGP